MHSKYWRIIRLTTVVLSIAIVAVVITACGSDNNASDSTAGNETDSMFVTAMIPHHEGAIEMARIAKERSDRKEILAMADAILQTQQAEINQMKSLQDSIPDGTASMMDDNQMSAMQAETAQLESVDNFDQAFIAAMIPHHQSAVEMAERAIASGSNADVQKLAQNIIKAQTEEIAQMEKWSIDWFGIAPSGSTGSTMGHESGMPGH